MMNGLAQGVLIGVCLALAGVLVYEKLKNKALLGTLRSKPVALNISDKLLLDKLIKQTSLDDRVYLISLLIPNSVLSIKPVNNTVCIIAAIQEDEGTQFVTSMLSERKEIG